MGLGPILPVKVPVTISTMLNFNRPKFGRNVGVGTCEQVLHSGDKLLVTKHKRGIFILSQLKSHEKRWGSFTLSCGKGNYFLLQEWVTLVSVEVFTWRPAAKAKAKVSSSIGFYAQLWRQRQRHSFLCLCRSQYERAFGLDQIKKKQSTSKYIGWNRSKIDCKWPRSCHCLFSSGLSDQGGTLSEVEIYPNYRAREALCLKLDRVTWCFLVRNNIS